LWSCEIFVKTRKYPLVKSHSAHMFIFGFKYRKIGLLPDSLSLHANKLFAYVDSSVAWFYNTFWEDLNDIKRFNTQGEGRRP
jgi:hypothetical protein